jgi:hypothetical protein
VYTDTAMALNNLAVLYYATGAYAKARAASRRARVREVKRRVSEGHLRVKRRAQIALLHSSYVPIRFDKSLPSDRRNNSAARATRGIFLGD